MMFSIELAQLIVALVGLTFSHWNLWVAVEDAIAMAGVGGPDHPNRMTALRSVSREIVLLMGNGILSLNGVINVLLDDDPPALEHTLTALLLIALTLLMSLDAMFERHSRMAFEAVVSSRRIWTFRSTVRSWIKRYRQNSHPVD